MMRPEDLAACIEEAFAGLDPPSFEEMAAADCSVEDEFLYAIESRTWQELRPLRQYIGDGSEIVALSSKAYQYYIPAYLYALIDEAGDERRLTSSFIVRGNSGSAVARALMRAAFTIV